MSKFYPAVAALLLALSAPSAAATFAVGPAVAETAPMSVLPDATKVPAVQLGALLLTLPVLTANGKAPAHVPCLSCVLPPSSGYTKPVARTLGLGEPLATVPATVKAAVLAVTYSDSGFTGSCKIHLVVAIGSLVVINQTSAAIAFKTGTFGYVSAAFTRPNIPFTGDVTISEQAICGSFKSNVVSTQVFVE
jgi:hypothetical protein